MAIERGRREEVNATILSLNWSLFWQFVGQLEHARVHPKFLHSNATSHKWAFGGNFFGSGLYFSVFCLVQDLRIK